MAKITKFILIYGLPDKDFYTKNKNEKILFCEMRPNLLGAKILAENLRKMKIKSTLICDNALGHLFFAKRIKKAYLFKFDGEIFPPGASVVKILANWHNVPVEILKGEAPKTTCLLDTNAKTFLGKKVTMKKIRAIAPQNEALI